MTWTGRFFYTLGLNLVTIYGRPVQGVPCLWPWSVGQATLLRLIVRDLGFQLDLRNSDLATTLVSTWEYAIKKELFMFCGRKLTPHPEHAIPTVNLDRGIIMRSSVAIQERYSVLIL